MLFKPKRGAVNVLRQHAFQSEDPHMLYWAFVFLVISIIAAIFGFAGIAGAAAGIAKLLFGIFIVIFVVLLLMGIFAGRAVTR
jgi:uncharacterized membrane protein YtjA (UPF0391 family)